MADFKVGKITHYYNKINVAVVELLDTLTVGDTIKISGHGTEFNQTVDSMQVEHEQIKEAKKGMAVGMRVDKEVKEGDEVFRVTA